MPASYWAEPPATATYLLNRRPCSAVQNRVPYTILYHNAPDYTHLRVFGCLCYPNMTVTTPHKLAPRSTACFFLGYPSSHKGYRCLDLSSRRVIISHHVIFDESCFSFGSTSQGPPSSLDFLLIGQAAPVPPCTAAAAPPHAAAPSNSDVERLRRSTLADDIDDPAILLCGPALHVSAPAAARTGDHMVPAGAPAGPAAAVGSPAAAPPPLPVPGQVFQHVYNRRPRPAPALEPATTSAPAAPLPAQAPAPPPLPSPPPPPRRPVTWSQTGTLRKVHPMNLTAAHSTISPIPANYRSGLADPFWRVAKADEYKALIDDGTWRLVPHPLGANVVMGKWIFKHKFHSDGSLARHKARWVVRGFSQQHDIDYDETFSPVVKPATIHVVLSIAAARSWPIHQLDVKNAILRGHLEETVYCQQPPGFVDPATPDHVCLLQRSLYGLKQAPQAWYQRFTTFIRHLGFTASASDTSLFVYKEGDRVAYLLLYVDDISSPPPRRTCSSASPSDYTPSSP
ncbi:retrotransposon protein, putative, Ty1-copia subclass [Panicum miliaceum]|uniref:Retrotransposon protein, putative, Ty1-copia subclass n=1 Tax=Panicum miliaceum TaxID=4540 RepID=A0A3L6RVL5_PANMI|nr:retrotransposon protein, putative, Ty1-copia subclass [Panicum miliaceum]